jgi:hypothetical protein
MNRLGGTIPHWFRRVSDFNRNIGKGVQLVTFRQGFIFYADITSVANMHVRTRLSYTLFSDKCSLCSAFKRRCDSI